MLIVHANNETGVGGEFILVVFRFGDYRDFASVILVISHDLAESRRNSMILLKSSQ